MAVAKKCFFVAGFVPIVPIVVSVQLEEFVPICVEFGASERERERA